ncbi:MAG: hypothetical protein ACTSYI_02205 [Promethearchaeota archaeon]
MVIKTSKKQVVKRAAKFWLETESGSIRRILLLLLIMAGLIGNLGLGYSSFSANSSAKAFSLPTRAELLSSGDYQGNILIQEGENLLKIISSAEEVLWEYNAPFPVIGDIELGDNNTVYVSDYESDRLIQLSLEKSPQILWEWDAHAISSINWSFFIDSQPWNNDSKLNFKAEVQSPSFYLGIRNIQFINASKFGSSGSSLLVCCENFNFVFELSLENETHSQIIWSYGKANIFQNLDLPTSAHLATNNIVYIGNRGSSTLFKLNYQYTYKIAEYSINFPHGQLDQIFSIHWLESDIILVATSGTYDYFFLNFTTTGESAMLSHEIPDILASWDIGANETHIVLVDPVNSRIYVLNKATFQIEASFGVLLIPKLFTFNWILILGYNLGSIGVFWIRKSKKDFGNLLITFVNLSLLLVIFALRFTLMDIFVRFI